MRKAFTYTELIVVLGLLLGLFTLASLNFVKPQLSASQNSTVTQLIADLRAQQIKAMVGDTEGTGVIQPYGLFFSAQGYTLFQGSSYDPNHPNNFAVNVSEPLSLSTTFPGSVVVFQALNGEILSYSSSSNTVTVVESQSSISRVIQLNRYGVVESY